MYSPRPPERTPFDVTPRQAGWLRRTASQLESLSRFGGENVSGGTLPTEIPSPLILIYGKIRNEESGSGSGAGSGHGSFSLSPAGTGFTDEEGYLAYAFDQIYDDYPWKGIVITNGISTTLPTTTRDGANYAYPLNNDFFNPGDNVLLKKAGKHWVIIGGVDEGGSGSGSGSGNAMTITCSDGSHHTVTISGSTITVN